MAGSTDCVGCCRTDVAFNAEGYCPDCAQIVGAWRETLAERRAAAPDVESAEDSLYRESLRPMTRELWSIVNHETSDERAAAQRKLAKAGKRSVFRRGRKTARRRGKI